MGAKDTKGLFKTIAKLAVVVMVMTGFLNSGFASDRRVTSTLLEPSEEASFQLVRDLAAQGVLDQATYRNLQVQLGNHLKDTLYLRVLQELYWDGTIERDAYRQLAREFALENWFGDQIVQQPQQTSAGLRMVTYVVTGDPLPRYLEKVQYAYDQVVIDETLRDELMVAGVETARGGRRTMMGSGRSQINRLTEEGYLSERARRQLEDQSGETVEYIGESTRQSDGGLLQVSWSPFSFLRRRNPVYPEYYSVEQQYSTPESVRYDTTSEADYNAYYSQGLPPVDFVESLPPRTEQQYMSPPPPRYGHAGPMPPAPRGGYIQGRMMAPPRVVGGGYRR